MLILVIQLYHYTCLVFLKCFVGRLGLSNSLLLLLLICLVSVIPFFFLLSCMHGHNFILSHVKGLKFILSHVKGLKLKQGLEFSESFKNDKITSNIKNRNL